MNLFGSIDSWLKDPLVLSLIIAGAGLAAYSFLSHLVRQLRKEEHPLCAVLILARDVVVPLSVVFYLLILVFDTPRESFPIKIIETVAWISVLWIGISLFTVIFFRRAADTTWRARVPGLFLDLIRVAFILVGASFVIAGVWHQNLGAFLATLGAGSIVLGLALQDTLGNLMSGIALLFERPFSEGDWIRVGDIIGTVEEINWRAVRIKTRNLELVTVPNSVIGKDKIINFSRPVKFHGLEPVIGFSYNDPPNTVKRVLLKTVEATRGVVTEPPPSIRTYGYRDFAVEYQVRFFIDDYARLPEILEDFMTQVWYAARRNRLTIPFPIRTVYKTEVPAQAVQDSTQESRQILKGVSLFCCLESQELDALARDAVALTFARDEKILRAGDAGDALYIIKSGAARVAIRDKHGHLHDVTDLMPGQFFGEMALLTGEARTADITALEDMEVLVIYKEALKNLLTHRPQLAEELAQVVAARQKGIQEAVEQIERQEDHRQGTAPAVTQSVILGRIKRFFGI